MIDDESDADMWRRKARAIRDHIEKFPDCIDRTDQETRAARFDRYAEEDEANAKKYGRKAKDGI